MLALVAIIYALCITTLLVMALRAPEGCQLPGIGFRYGPDPRQHSRKHDSDRLRFGGDVPFHTDGVARG